MAYSEKVLDHYENPRNVGSFAKDADDVGTGMVGAPACGDVMKLQIRVGADGRIEDAKFKTYGCGSAIASSSLVTEWVKGKTLEQALTIKNTHIAEELALPPVKIHCSILAEDAIKAAVADYKKKHERFRRTPRRSRRQSHHACLSRRIEDARMSITLTERAAKHVSNYIAKRGKGVGLAPRRAHDGVFRPRVQARVCRRLQARRSSFREPTASRWSSIPKACLTSMARNSISHAKV